MLRYHCANGLPDWIFEELRSIQEVSYRYDDEQSPEDLVESLADELAPCHPLPADRLLDGTSLLFEYEPEKIKVRMQRRSKNTTTKQSTNRREFTVPHRHLLATGKRQN